jgi:hypothetical protein
MRFTTRLAVFVLFLTAPAARSEHVLVPVSIFSAGASGSLWSTEIRVTNSSADDLSFRTVDLLANGEISYHYSFRPASYAVPAGTIRSFGAYELLTGARCTDLGCVLGVGGPALFGTYELDVDAGLTVEAAVLTGVAPAPTGFPVLAGCKSWQGGYSAGDGPRDCNEGAGPLLRASRTYFSEGTRVSLTWLHTHPTRRTNVTFYNPDPVPATVTLTVTSADGLSTVSSPVTVPAHSPLQVNDIFSSSPFDAIRVHNGTTTAAARATIVSTTRLYAIGWVISNQNNTVTISEPR